MNYFDPWRSPLLVLYQLLDNFQEKFAWKKRWP
jgi:hypothetical protein